MTSETCRFCNSTLNQFFLDLGKTPLANSFLSESDLQKDEQFFGHSLEEKPVPGGDTLKSPAPRFNVEKLVAYRKTCLTNFRKFRLARVQSLNGVLMTKETSAGYVAYLKIYIKG